jgi:hypothetical protein
VEDVPLPPLDPIITVLSANPSILTAGADGKILNTVECVNGFAMSAFTMNSFVQLEFVPASLTSKWAQISSRIMADLIAALNAPIDEPGRVLRIGTALRWYVGLPQLFLRSPHRTYDRTVRILERTMDQFLAGDYATVISTWYKQRSACLLRDRKRKNPREPLADALKILNSGHRRSISRSIGVLEGNGVTSCDNPAVRQQMLQKHPQSTIGRGEEGPAVRADQMDAIDLESLTAVVKDLDPLVGVGPRGFKADYLMKIFIGRMANKEAADAAKHFHQLGQMYLNARSGMDGWVRATLGAGLLTPLHKSMTTSLQPRDQSTVGRNR